MYRRQQVFKGGESHSFFLWGARQTGKSTLLKHAFFDDLYIDLLQSEVYRRLTERPEELREIAAAQTKGNLIVVDEVQKIPSLLNEVHWLIENGGKRFILSGSSPRKILRSGTNLLGGRALKYNLFPLTSAEIPDLDLERALEHGLLPNHYDAEEAWLLLEAYVGSYLQDEIAAETRIRNLQGFSSFLEQAAFSNGEIVNYSNIASECGVSSPSVKEYFLVLQETLIGRFVPAYKRKPKRRIVQAPKFYFFDVGVANFLQGRRNLTWPSPERGAAFEHFIYMELYAYAEYSVKRFKISYWRTSSGFEVDFILNENEIAIEVKSTTRVNARHAKGIRAFAEEYKVEKKIIVSRDPILRKTSDDILIYPWQTFLAMLWSGDII